MREFFYKNNSFHSKKKRKSNRFFTYVIVRSHSVIDFRFPVVESIHFVLYHIPVLLHENVDLNKSNNRINQARKDNLFQANERTNKQTHTRR